MPELPEIASRARQMDALLSGKTICTIEIIQPKCLNLPPQEFTAALSGATLGGTQYRGKWLLTETDKGWLLLNLGMGGEILLVSRQTLPQKYRLIFDFQDDTCLAINFWWFGYVHHAAAEKLHQHPMLAKLGPNALDLSAGQLYDMVKEKRGTLKSFLLDQSSIAGIGNAYIHDILFLARLHPMRQLKSLSQEDVQALALAIQAGLRPAMEKGGAFYEMDLNGNKGGFAMEDIIVGYRENQPCPNCNTPIEKIKTGSTSTYICPQCQPLNV